MNLSTISSVSSLYEARMLMMFLNRPVSRRKAAPVNGAMKGTPALAATGVAEREVGVPTSPIKANTSWSSMRLRVLRAAASGS